MDERFRGDRKEPKLKLLRLIDIFCPQNIVQPLIKFKLRKSIYFAHSRGGLALFLQEKRNMPRRYDETMSAFASATSKVRKRACWFVSTVPVPMKIGTEVKFKGGDIIWAKAYGDFRANFQMTALLTFLNEKAVQ